jgi:PAS domain S-box-containing protein
MCLELMIVTHRGISKTIQRVFKPSTPDGEKEINWGLALIVVFKIELFALLCAFPTFSTSPTIALYTGLGVITSLAATRILGWNFVYREQEMKKYVSKVTNTMSKVTNVVSSKVSFGGESVGGSVNQSFMSSFGIGKGNRFYHEKSASFNSGSAGDVESQNTASTSTSKRIDNVYDEMFDAVVIADLSGMIITVNKMALEVFGYEEKTDLIGENLAILVGGGEAENHDAYIRNFSRKGKTDSNIGKQRVLYGKRKDGTEFQALIGIRRRERQLVGYIRDMSELLGGGKSQSPLVITNLSTIDSKVQRVLNDSSFDCIAVSNMQGIIQGVNQMLVKEFGYHFKEELVGQKLQMIIGGGDEIRNNHDAFIANFSTKSKEERNTSTVLGKQRILYARRADGSEFQCIVGVHMIEGTELLAGFIRNLDKLVKSSQ